MTASMPFSRMCSGADSGRTSFAACSSAVMADMLRHSRSNSSRFSSRRLSLFSSSCTRRWKFAPVSLGSRAASRARVRCTLNFFLAAAHKFDISPTARRRQLLQLSSMKEVHTAYRPCCKSSSPSTSEVTARLVARMGLKAKSTTTRITRPNKFCSTAVHARACTLLASKSSMCTSSCIEGAVNAAHNAAYAQSFPEVRESVHKAQKIPNMVQFRYRPTRSSCTADCAERFMYAAPQPTTTPNTLSKHLWKAPLTRSLPAAVNTTANAATMPEPVRW
mmetsp:Transcript_36812/g.70527  ORF Transcript_36812/g.70527 Transcript_36812/m.70527 type:complete len:277 (-) Transcript_36812:1009-1839(-)